VYLLSIRTTNVLDSPSDDPAPSYDSKNGMTAVQDDSAVDIMADQPRYCLQHVHPGLLPGLSEALRHMTDLEIPFALVVL
jgi:hypothetical protein